VKFTFNHHTSEVDAEFMQSPEVVRSGNAWNFTFIHLYTQCVSF